MLALSWLYGLEMAVGRREESVDRPHGALKGVLLSWQVPLERLGRHSLFIYWIHVELVYGYASSLWRQRLPLWGTAIGYVAFSALMYGALIARDWIASKRQHIGHFRDDRAVDKRAAL